MARLADAVSSSGSNPLRSRRRSTPDRIRRPALQGRPENSAYCRSGRRCPRTAADDHPGVRLVERRPASAHVPSRDHPDERRLGIPPGSALPTGAVAARFQDDDVVNRHRRHRRGQVHGMRCVEVDDAAVALQPRLRAFQSRDRGRRVGETTRAVMATRTAVAGHIAYNTHPRASTRPNRTASARPRRRSRPSRGLCPPSPLVTVFFTAICPFCKKKKKKTPLPPDRRAHRDRRRLFTMFALLRACWPGRRQ